MRFDGCEREASVADVCLRFVLVEQRQFSRLIEMLQLLSVDETDARAMKAYRLQVKERLYRFNFVRTLSILVVILCGRS